MRFTSETPTLYETSLSSNDMFALANVVTWSKNGLEVLGKASLTALAPPPWHAVPSRGAHPQ